MNPEDREVQTIYEVVRDHVIRVLDHFNGNRTHAADALGITVRHLRVKISEYKEQGFAVPEPLSREK